MADKDQFTFEDDDDFPETDLGNQKESPESDLGNDDEFPETDLGNLDASPASDMDSDDEFPEMDLSAAFSDGEHEAEVPVLDEPVAKGKSPGNSRTRILLIVLLLVVAGGAGAYYFMGLGGTTPSVPSAPVPAQKTAKSVALPPQPAKAPAPKAKTQTAPTAKPVTVAVPPPPPPPAAKPSAKEVPAQKPVTAEKPKSVPVAKSAKKTASEKPKSATKVAVPAPKATPAPQTKVAAKPAAPAPQKATAVIPPPAKPVETPKPVVQSKLVAGGAYALDAGSYLLESNRKALVEKIKNLGYEPLITPIDATLDMTRLRLGTFDKDEVQEALDFARTIEQGAYSAPAGDRYVVYAGTFLKSGNVDKLTQRFLAEGIKVHPEPVQVVRTLSRVRFGSFATKEDAAAAAREIGEAGLKASVVKAR
jgi:cell division septation protein DedD